LLTNVNVTEYIAKKCTQKVVENASQNEVSGMSERYENLIEYIRNTRSKYKMTKAEMFDHTEWYVTHRLLTNRNISFCWEYFKDLNRTRAYMRAYGCSYRTANINANRLWKNVYIQEMIRCIQLQLQIYISEALEFERLAKIFGLSFEEKQKGRKEIQNLD